ncbi:hypothetical protein AeMF1_015740 [Aphanomyces euteiches]|nr:hypothetical protein AeMF1_015740 [Aphanomyces euteiches]KAH9197281.1 hypothetical protein AeNC1_000763 [Aphanomyces euteiches]
MDCDALTAAFVSICTNVVFVYHWVLRSMRPPLDQDSASNFHPRETRSIMTMTDFEVPDSIHNCRREAVDQGVLATPYAIDRVHTETSKIVKTTKPSKNGCVPHLQTSERGLKHQLKLQEKIREWQKLAAKQRIFKATPLPRQYKCRGPTRRNDRQSLQDEKNNIEAEKKQLSIDMLHLLNAMARKQTQALQVPLERS